MSETAESDVGMVMVAETHQVRKRTNIVATVSGKGGKGWKPIVICGVIELVIALPFIIVGVVMILRSGRLQTPYLIDNGSFPIVLAVLIIITAILALIAGRKRSDCALKTTLFFGIPLFVVLISFFWQFVLVCADFYVESETDAKKTAEELAFQRSNVRLALVATETVLLGIASVVMFVMDVYVCRKVCTCCCCCRKEPEISFSAQQSQNEVVDRAVFVVGPDGGVQRVGGPQTNRAVEPGPGKY